jgi:hypothetical protein
MKVLLLIATFVSLSSLALAADRNNQPCDNTVGMTNLPDELLFLIMSHLFNLHCPTEGFNVCRNLWLANKKFYEMGQPSRQLNTLLHQNYLAIEDVDKQEKVMENDGRAFGKMALKERHDQRFVRTIVGTILKREQKENLEYYNVPHFFQPLISAMMAEYFIDSAAIKSFVLDILAPLYVGGQISIDNILMIHGALFSNSYQKIAADLDSDLRALNLPKLAHHMFCYYLAPFVQNQFPAKYNEGLVAMDMRYFIEMSKLGRMEDPASFPAEDRRSDYDPKCWEYIIENMENGKRAAN